MQVAKGYKQTEVGVIPEDWTTTPAVSICQSVIDCKNRTAPVVSDDEYAVVRTPNVRNGKFVRKELRFTDAESFKIWTSRAVPQDGDILITREAPMGEVCLKPIGYKVCLGQRMMLYRPNPDKANSHYLLHALMSQPVQSNLTKKVGGSTVGHAKVDDIRNVILPLPPTKAEQEAIAEALSDADSLIESLQQLIAKKRQIKQGAMQELLTGKRRVQGLESNKGYKQTEVGMIPEDWESGVISDLIRALSSGVSVNSSNDLNSTFSHESYILKTSCVSQGAFDKSEVKLILPVDLKRAKCSPKRDSIIVSRMNTPNLVGECGYVSEDYDNLFLPDRLWITTKYSSKLRSTKWLATLLSYSPYSKKIKEAATGTSGSMKNISKPSFLATPIPIPTKAEQEAIATILSNMDEEITTLETKLTKAQQIKQGMMSELLTGKTRLV